MKLNGLNFNQHPNWADGTHAKHTFPNGYGVSVITGSDAYTSTKKPYEVAILHHGKITYDTHITDDVLGYLDDEAVNLVLCKVESLDA